MLQNVGVVSTRTHQCNVAVVEQGTRHLFIPAERRIPKIRIETRQAEALESQRIVVVIDSWPRNSRYPQVSATSVKLVSYLKS